MIVITMVVGDGGVIIDVMFMTRVMVVIQVPLLRHLPRIPPLPPSFKIREGICMAANQQPTYKEIDIHACMSVKQPMVGLV